MDPGKLQIIGFDMGGTSTGAPCRPACVLHPFLAARTPAPVVIIPPSWSPLPPTLLLLSPADVSRYAGRYEHVFESTTAGVTIQAPQLDINTVAAGGGSRLFFRSGVFQAGGQHREGSISPAWQQLWRGCATQPSCPAAQVQVGPESAGAHPGPVCYRKNGYLAITGKVAGKGLGSRPGMLSWVGLLPWACQCQPCATPLAAA